MNTEQSLQLTTKFTDTDLMVPSQDLSSLFGIDREQLRERIFEYYEFLQKNHPDNINWDGDRLEYTEFDAGSFVLNYYSNSGELSFTPAMFAKKERDKLCSTLESVSECSPADIVLPLPYLDVIVPFLDVKKISYFHFSSNEDI